jgi:hypothetical protein
MSMKVLMSVVYILVNVIVISEVVVGSVVIALDQH